MAEEGYKIWIRRQDTKAKITDENIWAGNNPGGQYSKQSSGQTRGEQYAYVYFPTWADVLKAIDEEETARLSFTISPATIPASGGNATITITANTGWTLTTNVGSLSPTSGNGNGSSTLTVPEYTGTTQDRQICVTATTVGGGMSVVHCITQQRAAVTPSIRITASQTSVSSSAANITLTITSNVDGWRISSNQGWATIGGGATGSGNDTRTLAITQNPGDERSVTITVSGSGVSDNVTITQAKEVIVPTLSLSANTANISADGGNITLKVTSNINGWTLSSNQTWARITNPSGSSTATRTLNIAENTSTTDSRSVIITVTGSGLTDTVTITQEKKILEPYLTISTSPTTVQSTGGTVTISVSSNTGWTLTTTEGTLSVSSGNGNRDVVLTIPNYSGVDSRTITVIAKFTSTGEEQDRKAITQNGITPSIVPDSSVTSLFSDISCDDETVYTVNVVANIEWTAETNNSWITISNITSSSFKVSFSENGGNTRNGSILVKATDRSLSAYDKTISVRQVKCVEYYIRLKNASDQNAFVSVPCSGFGSKTIELLINLPEGTTWYAESDGTDWVNIQKYSDNVVVSFDDNDGTERTTQITISDTIGQYENVELQVKQLECEVPVIQIYDLEDVVNDFLNVPCSGFPEPGYIFTVDVLPFSEWIITEDTNDTWVHVSKSNSPAGVSVFGQDLPLMIQTAKVVIDANGTTQREATIIVDLADKSLGATPISISIIQSACDAPDYYIKFNDETTAKTLNADCEGNSETYQLLISIPEGTSWVAESDSDWVMCEKGEDSVTITVSENNSGSHRSTQVEIHSNPDAYGCSLSIEQDYCAPSSLLIEGVTSYTAPTNISFEGGQVSYNFSYSNVSDIGVANIITATGATADVSTLKLTVGFIPNSTSSPKSWGVTITGRTPSNEIISATTIGTQDGSPDYYIRLDDSSQQSIFENISCEEHTETIALDISLPAGATWNFTSDDMGENGWIHMHAVGNSLVVTIDENPDGPDPRTSTIVINSDYTGLLEHVELSVSQYKCPDEQPYFTITDVSALPNYYGVNEEAYSDGMAFITYRTYNLTASYDTNVPNDYEWSVRYENSPANWIVITPDRQNNTFNLTYDDDVVNVNQYNKAYIDIKYHGSTIQTLPVVTTDWDEDGYIYISDIQVSNPSKDELTYNSLQPKMQYLDIWLRTNKYTDFHYLTADDDGAAKFNGLSFYDENDNEIYKIYPSKISGTDIVTGGVRHIKVRVPANILLSAKERGFRLETEDYHAILNAHDHAEVYINQQKNSYTYSDHYIEMFAFESADPSATAVTIPSDARQYSNSQYDSSIKPYIGIKALRKDAAGTLIDNWVYVDDYIEGGGVLTDKLSLTVPSWMSIEPDQRTSGGQYNATMNNPFAVNVLANQSTSTTGSSRTGDVVLTYKGCSPNLSMTKSVTQSWSQIHLPDVDMKILSGGTYYTEVNATATVGGYITVDPSSQYIYIAGETGVKIRIVGNGGPSAFTVEQPSGLDWAEEYEIPTNSLDIKLKNNNSYDYRVFIECDKENKTHVQLIINVTIV